MAKNLDGIKKLNSEEIKKNRRIALSYILGKDSELDEGRKAASRAAFGFNKVDGIKLNRIFSTKPKAKNMPEKPAPARDNKLSSQEKIERAEAIKKEIAEKAEREAEEKANVEAAGKRQEKLRLEKQEREKRKLKRQKAIKLFKKNLNNKLNEIFSIVKKNLVYGMLYLIVFLIISYIVFCLLVLRFNINDDIIGKMARILPVPAAVTSQGIINYYDFLGIKNNNYADLNPAEKKNSLARWLILKNLSGKYGLPVNSPGKALAIAFTKDEDFNQIGLSRIKKISQLLKNVDDLKTLSKYADEYGDATYYGSEAAAEKFGQAVFNLNDKQTSDIIFSENGYYIIQTVDNKNGQLGIKYLFVGAKTLDQYVSEKLAKIKIFILAN